MSVTIVVGGQYGSEGKGKMVAYLSLKEDFNVVVRCGGPNSGHTVIFDNKKHVLRQVPTGFVNENSKLYLAPGSIISPDILLKEIDECRINSSRIKIDPYSTILTDEEISEEKNRKLDKRISSTLSGTGAATANRVFRDAKLKLAKDIPKLKPFLTDVSKEVNEALDNGKKVLIEGTQGFGLSLFHNKNFPYSTSRDTSASAYLSELGISPLLVKDIILVIRTFPIRVSGKQAGKLEEEVSWEFIQKESGSPNPLGEYTSVTKKLRRVGIFEDEVVKRAVMVNRPTKLAIHGIDYISYNDFGKTNITYLSEESIKFLDFLKNLYDIKIGYIFTGPDLSHIIDISK